MSKYRSIRGFTLIELMVTIAVMAIGMAIAFPSFTGMIRSNRAAAGTNALIATFNLARTEAIRSNRGAGVCPSTNGTSCATSGGWEQGWLVWSDVDGMGDFDVGEPVVRYFQASTGLSITTAANTVVFDQRGRLVPSNDVAVKLQTSKCPDDEKLVRNITVSQFGQIRYEPALCKI